MSAHELLKFLTLLPRAPAQIGAIVPSSRWLAKAMVEWIPLEKHGIVVELGGGTGAITRAILNRGLHQEQLIVIEKFPEFTTLLRRKHPNIRVIEADAFELRSVLASIGITQVHAIISSLPLRNFSCSQIQKLIEEIAQVLVVGGLWTQFGYHLYDRTLVKRREFLNGKFRMIGTKIVWLNLPPARVCAFRRI